MNKKFIFKTIRDKETKERHIKQFIIRELELLICTQLLSIAFLSPKELRWRELLVKAFLMRE